MRVSREQFRNRVLEFLWRQWSALGFAGGDPATERWIIDPEALLWITTRLGREPRLFDEVFDWLDINGSFINLQRLKTLGQRIGDAGVLAAMAEHLSRRTVHAKWKVFARKTTGSRVPELLFPGIPSVRAPDEIFARHGWLRGPVRFRHLSQSPDPRRPTNLLLQLRALFGLQARAEVMAYLLAQESGHAGEMARRLGYFPRTLQSTLNDLARSGQVEFHREGLEKRFQLRHDDWRFLHAGSTGPGTHFMGYPRWVDWVDGFEALEAVARFLDRPELEKASPELRAIEMRAAVEALDPGWVRQNIRIPPGAAAEDQVQAVIHGVLGFLQSA